MKRQSTRRVKAKSSSNRGHILLRFAVIITFIMVFAGAITMKLFRTTIVDAEKWNKKASDELSKVIVDVPIRGDILAADGSVLATNIQYYNVRIDWASEGFNDKEFAKQLPALCDTLAKYYPYRTSAQWKAELKAQRDTTVRSRYYRLVGNLTYTQLEHFRTFPFFDHPNHNKTGYIEEAVRARRNPYGKMAKRSIGYVGMTKECPEVHGQAGLERALDKLLYGTPGVKKLVPFTHRMGAWTDKPAINGYTVTTTIDIALQDIVEEELNAMLDSTDAEWGCAVLLEVATGDIKAISNLEKDPDHPGKYIEGYNRVMMPYEPGSVIKTISMLIALEDGLVCDPDSMITIGHRFQYATTNPKRAITDSHYIGEQRSVTDVIAQSSNIGMARIITNPAGPYDSNPLAFRDRLLELGMGLPLNTGIYEEELPRIKKDPSRLDLSRMSYGYTTAIPPIYTATFYNAIANDGKIVRPRLIKKLTREGVDSVIPVSYLRSPICSPENAAKLRRMLRETTLTGTARNLNNPYVAIAGKTGTANDIGPGGYTKKINRLAFCSFFPADNPKYTMMVLTFHPKKKWMGPGTTSGRVVLNTALKMYARGMFGDTSDYTTDGPADKVTNVNMSISGADSEALRRKIGPNDYREPPKVITAGELTADSIPNVKYLNLRDAVNRLERAGVNVAFTGEGRVINQTYNRSTNTATLTLSTIY